MMELVLVRPGAGRRFATDHWSSTLMSTSRHRTKLKIASNGEKLEYPFLSDNEVRLVHINSGRLSDPIMCDLYCATDLVRALKGQTSDDNLECSPYYYALSYTWGDPDKTREITVSGHRILVTKNLHDFLWQAREILSTPEKERDPPMPKVTGSLAKDRADRALFWIDALCIDQTNHAEKEKQIPRMGDIYNKAHEVIVWLGVNDNLVIDKHIRDDFRFARGHMFVVRQCYPESKDSETAANILHRSPVATIAEHLRQVGNLTGLGLIDVAGRSWFTRMWVGQEVALADGGAWVYAGAHCIAFNDLVLHLAAAHNANFRPAKLANNVMMEEQVFSKLKDMAYLRHHYREFAKTWYKKSGHEAQVDAARFLEGSILLSHGRECLNARDKIYGLLGMIDSDQLPSTLAPNYRKSLEQVYREYATYILSSTGSLSLLYTVRSELKEGPSWVPDLRWSGNFHFNDKRSGPLAFVDGGLTLILQGWQVDVVSETYDGPDLLPAEKSASTKFRNLVSSTVSKFVKFLDKVSLIRGRSKEDCRDEWLKYATSTTFLVREEEASSNRMQKLRSNLNAIYQNCWSAEGEETLLIERLVRGHLVTQTGMIGSYERSDRHACSGDLVCLVKGSIPPLILRPEGRPGYYTFVSVCMMYCEPPCVYGGMTSYKPQGELRNFAVV